MNRAVQKMAVDLSTPEAVADFLDAYNGWRRAGAEGDDNDATPPPMPHPSDVGMAIDAAVAILRAQAQADMALLPRRLTAENGAKAALSGEFSESTRVFCVECDGTGMSELRSKCDSCDGAGELSQLVTVGWNSIKRIHDRVVELFDEEDRPQ